jgi:hypothetical protein
MFTYHKSLKLGLYPNTVVMQAKHNICFRVERNPCTGKDVWNVWVCLCFYLVYQQKCRLSQSLHLLTKLHKKNEKKLLIHVFQHVYKHLYVYIYHTNVYACVCMCISICGLHITFIFYFFAWIDS